MMVEFRVEPIPDPVRVSLRPHSIAVSIGVEPIYIFDPAGRLHEAFVSGRNYLRGLDGQIMEKYGRSTVGAPIRRTLSPGEADGLVERITRTMALIHAAVAAGRVRVPAAGTPGGAPHGPEAPAGGERADARAGTVRDALAIVAGWDAARLAADAAEFGRIYRPVSILPPDQYLALVLQLTEGCSHNECTFCTFYRDRPFRIKRPDEFAAHVAAVKRFFGPALRMRRTLFLADANAVVTPQRLLAPALERVSREFDIIPAGAGVSAYRREHPGALDGVHAFVDAFTGRLKSPEDFAELAGFGLRRVYIGLESGHDPLLAWVRKAGTAADAVETVRTIKAGGVNVGVIVMIGIGGRRFAAGHVEDTLRAVNAMDLGAGDFFYVSEFVEPPGGEYAAAAAADAIEPLSPADMAAQVAAIRTGLRFPGPPPKLSVYDIREFIY